MSKALRILLCTFGSLGDLHPYIALAKGLKARGHIPIVVTFDEYRAAVLAARIGFAPMRPALDTMGSATDVTRYVLTDVRRGPERLMRELFIPHVRESYDDLNRIAEGADLIVSHPITFAAPLVAEKRRMLWASTVLSPMSLMSNIDPPLFPGMGWLFAARKLGIGVYRALLSAGRMRMASWEKPIRELRAELGIPSRKIASFEGQYSRHLNLALFSPVLAKPQSDWPGNTVVCGFPRYDGPPIDPAKKQRFDAFVDSKPPIVFGLGSSAVMIAGRFWPEAIHAVQALGARAVLITGTSSPPIEGLPDSIAQFDYLPYSIAFEPARAVVHTCGIGTLGQALVAGRPQLMLPVAFDQFDNARRAHEVGVGSVLRFAKAHAHSLTAALQDILDTHRYTEKAQTASQAITEEDAVGCACDAIESLLH